RALERAADEALGRGGAALPSSPLRRRASRVLRRGAVQHARRGAYGHEPAAGPWLALDRRRDVGLPRHASAHALPPLLARPAVNGRRAVNVVEAASRVGIRDREAARTDHGRARLLGDRDDQHVRYGSRVKRCAIVLAVLGWLVVGYGSAVAQTEPSCRTLAPRSSTYAVFGHFASLAQAKAYKAEAAARIFKGLKIVNNGCGDYEVFIGGADSSSARGSF